MKGYWPLEMPWLKVKLSLTPVKKPSTLANRL